MNKENLLKKAIRSGRAELIRNAFQQFYQENVRLVYRVLIDSMGKDDETDDDIQQSFLVLLQNTQNLLGLDKIVSYWIRAAKNLCANRRSESRTLAEDVEETPNNERAIPEFLAEQELFAKAEQWLGHPDYDIVVLRTAYGYTEREIANRIGIGEDAVHYRYRKGIKLLRRRLKNEK